MSLPSTLCMIDECLKIYVTDRQTDRQTDRDRQTDTFKQLPKLTMIQAKHGSVLTNFTTCRAIIYTMHLFPGNKIYSIA